MVPFEVDYEFEQITVTLTVEQLDRLADEDGYIRYTIRSGDRRGVIYVNVEDQLQPPVTPQDAEDYFEKVYYPEQPRFLSTAEDFSMEEMQVIGNAIRQYNFKLYFNRFMDRSQPPVL